MRKYGDRALTDLVAAGRVLRGAAPGQPHRFPDTIRRLAFGAYSTKKRCFKVLAEIVQLAAEERLGELKGTAVQGCRWVSHALQAKNEEDAWRLNYLPDPVLDRAECAPIGSGLVDESIQDVRQLTALIAVLKDEGVLLPKLGVTGPPNSNAGKDKDKDKEKNGRGKGDGKGKDRNKNSVAGGSSPTTPEKA